jgi:hypothetical protein
VAQLVAVGDAVIGRRKMPVAVRQRLEKAAMPRLAGSEGDLKAQPPVGIHCLRLATLRRHRQRAHEIGIAVARA